MESPRVPDRRAALLVGVASLVITGAMMAGFVWQAGNTRGVGATYVRGFENATGIDLMLAVGDGQAYAAIARDPTLSDPSPFPSVEEAAYRAQRPLMSYAGWLFALGRPEWVPGAFVALSVFGGGLAGGAFSLLLARRGITPWAALGVLVLPGSIAALQWLQPELLALALAGFGLFLWERQRRGWAAGLLFALAGLAREVLLLVPLVLAVGALRRRAWREVAWLASPMLIWLLWGLIVRIRYGFWWFEWHVESKLEMPIVGIARGVATWRDAGTIASNAIIALLLLAIGIAVLVRREPDHLRPITLAYLAVPLIFWTEMWHRWENFARVLLPLSAFGLVLVARSLARARSDAGESLPAEGRTSVRG